MDHPFLNEVVEVVNLWLELNKLYASSNGVSVNYVIIIVIGSSAYVIIYCVSFIQLLKVADS
jgi:hypothetical protein